MIELVAEIGINHNGNINIAKKLIDIASSAGCHYVKFQKRDVETAYTQEELDSPRESPWGNTFRSQKVKLEFGIGDYFIIDSYCKSRNIKWFTSVWDEKSLDFIGVFNIPFIKIPSALITNIRFIEQVQAVMIPVIISTGMSTMDMIDEAVRTIDNLYCIMHCTSTYPSSPEEQNLSCIQTLKTKYSFTKIGFSNHSPGLPFMLAAGAIGAEMIEFHITLDRSMYGSDQAASIEPEGVFRLCKWVKDLDKALGDGKKKIYESEMPILKKLRR